MDSKLILSGKNCISCDSNEFVQFYNATQHILLPNHEAIEFEQCLECCYQCGLVRQEANNTYSDDRLNYYYQQTYRTPINPASITKEDIRLENAYKRLEFIKKFKPEGNLLEIGFGDGVFLNVAARNYTCTGLDPSAGYNFVKDHLKQNGVEVLDTSIEQFDSTRKFDVICSFLVLEHIKDPLAFLNHQLRQLAPDGALIIEVPDIRRYVFFNSETLLTHEHVYHYCLESLTSVLEKLNVELIGSSNNNVSYGFSQIAAFKVSKDKKSGALTNPIGGFKVLKEFQSFFEIRNSYRHKMTKTLAEITAQNNSVAIYGTGFLFNYAVNQCGLDLTKVSYILDDTKDKIGTLYNNKEIKPLTFIKNYQPDTVIIFSEMFFEPLKQKVIEVLGLGKVNIVNIHQLSIS
jgi:2-polyprenyl-3-methyl-5-hydroxy-6-metoxy-1,4-benzoquinol methylase